LHYRDGRKFKGTFSRGQFDGQGEITVKDQEKNVKKGIFGGCSGLYYIEKEIEREPLDENSSQKDFVGKGTLYFAGINFTTILRAAFSNILCDYSLSFVIFCQWILAL